LEKKANNDTKKITPVTRVLISFIQTSQEHTRLAHQNLAKT